MNHPTRIARYHGSLADLAGEVGDLRYDALRDFLRELSAKIERDSVADRGRGRAQLAASLNDCAANLSGAADNAEAAWRIAAPFMQAVYDPPVAAVKVRNAKSGAWYDMRPIILDEAADTIAPDDIARIVAVCNESLIYNILFIERCTGQTYSEADAERFVAWAGRGWREKSHFVYLLRDSTGSIAGALDIKSANLSSSEIGYWLSQDHSGVMANAVIALCVMARQVGYEELFALVREGNDRSVRVLKRAGFDAGERLSREKYIYTRYVRRFV